VDTKTIALVQASWQQVTPIATEAAALFYRNLFAADRTLETLFKGDMHTQGEKLMQMIGVAVGKLDRTDVLIPVLEGLARRHVAYGVEEAHYATVGAALLDTLEQGLGAAFTPEVRAAWTTVYGVMSDVMTSAARAGNRA